MFGSKTCFTDAEDLKKNSINNFIYFKESQNLVFPKWTDIMYITCIAKAV